MRRAELAVAAVLAVAPWAALAWTPPTLLAALFAALAIGAAALHGFGAALAIAFDRTSRRRSTIDAMCLGIAVVLLVGGWLAALGRFDHTGQLALLISGLVLHVFAIFHRRREADLVARVRGAIRSADAADGLLWLVVFAILALHVLGLFASLHDSGYDDDGHWFGAVKRMRDTGGFDDPIGYGRAYQLGGSVVSSVLSATVGDIRCTRVGEALGFILTVLALAQLSLSARDRRGAGAMIFLLLALALSSKAQGELDTSLFWLPCALFVATFRHLLARSRTPRAGDAVWLVLLLAALVAVRLEYLAFAAAMTVTARGRRSLALLGGIALCLAPTVIEWYRAGDLDHTHAFARYASLIAAGLVAGLGMLLPRQPKTPLAVFTYAVAACALLMFGIPTPAGEFTGRLVWVPVFALLYVSLACLAQAQWSKRDQLADLHYAVGTRTRFRFMTAGILVLTAVAFIMRAQDPTVRMSWRNRFRGWVQDAAELAIARPVPPVFPPYAQLLAQVPAGATVLTWLDHPERIDDTTHTLLDLRVPRHKDVRAFSWGLSPSPMPGIIRWTGARYMLVEGDRLEAQRTRDSVLFAIWCTPQNTSADPVLHRPAVCADPLEREIIRHHVVDAVDGVTLVQLR